ncbi:hypothetical protein [Embleya sp. NPDC001921]
MDASLIGREYDLARLTGFLTDIPHVGGAVVLPGEPTCIRRFPNSV